MLLHQPVIIDVPHDMAVGKHHILFLGIAQEGHDAAQGGHPPVIQLVGVAEGGEEIQPFVFPGKVPGFPGTDMIHQGLVVALRNHAHLGDAGVDHVGQWEIDQTVPAAEGD